VECKVIHKHMPINCAMAILVSRKAVVVLLFIRTWSAFFNRMSCGNLSNWAWVKEIDSKHPAVARRDKDTGANSGASRSWSPCGTMVRLTNLLDRNRVEHNWQSSEYITSSASHNSRVAMMTREKMWTSRGSRSRHLDFERFYD